MTMMKRLTALVLALATLCLTLAGCGGGDTTDNDAQSGGSTLVYGSGDYTRINPAMDEHGEINVLLFDGLTDHDGTGQIVPRLAERWDYDPDTMTYTFHLAQGVTWHDGEPFTAADVKFTFEAIMDPDNGSENAPNYEDVTNITVIDDHTVSFTLSAVNTAFLEYMTMAILPRHLLEGEDMQTADFFRAPVGTGPYKLESWDVGQSITLVKNPDYFAGAANIDTIVFKIVTDSNAKTMQLQTGELDLAQVTPKDAAAFEGKTGYTVYDMTTSDYRGILYNFNNAYWQENADLIPAISCAIDRQAIVDAVLLGKGEVAYSPLQRNIYNDPDVERWDYDPARAEQLLTDAGCTRDAEGFWQRNGARIGFTINASPDDQVRIDMAQAAAQQLHIHPTVHHVAFKVPQLGVDVLVTAALGVVHVIQLAEDHVKGLLQGVEAGGLVVLVVVGLLYPKVGVYQGQGLRGQILDLQVPHRVVGGNVSQGRQTPLGEPLVCVVVVEIGHPLTGFAPELADVVAQGGTGDQSQVNEAAPGLEGPGYRHSHVVDSGDVVQSLIGSYLHTQPQQFVDVLSPETAEKLVVLLRHTAVRELLFRAEGKIQPGVEGQGPLFGVQQHLEELQVAQRPIPLGRGVAMIRRREKQGQCHLIRIAEPPLRRLWGQVAQQGPKGLQRRGTGKAGADGGQGREDLPPVHTAEDSLHIRAAHTQLPQKVFFLKGLRHLRPQCGAALP